MATIPERITALDERLKAHEEANRLALYNLSTRIEEVGAVATEAHEMSAQTNTLVAQMPRKIIDAIESKNKQRRMELKDWLLALMVIGSFLSPWIIPLVYKGSH